MLLQTVYPGLGGAGTVAFDLVKYLFIKKVENQICFFGNEKISEDYKKELKKNKLHFHHIRYNFFLIGNLKFLIFLFKFKPNKILMHNYLILPLLIYKLFFSIDIFTVIHTSPHKLEQTCKKNFYFKKLLDLIFIFSKKIIFVNRTNSKLKILKKFNNKILIIPNAVDTQVFKNKPKKKNKFTSLGMALRFTEKNRVDILLDLLQKLNNKKIHFKLFLAGDGEDYKNIKNKIFINKLSGFIKLEGNLNKYKLAKFYNKLDIYIHLSDYEFMSTSLLQAMSCELRIIASNLYENKFIIKASKKNLFVKNNINYIASKIENLVKNKKIRSTVTENRAYVNFNNSMFKVGEKYLKTLSL